MSQLFAPVLLLDEDELWTPTTALGTPYESLICDSTLVNVVYRILMYTPAIVCWMGDVATGEHCADLYPNVPKNRLEQFRTTASGIPASNGNLVITRSEANEVLGQRHGKFLANLTKKEYFPMNECLKRANAIDVLPFMTLVAYPEILSLDTEKQHNGSWAFDKLQLLSTEPKGYTNVLESSGF